MFLNNNDFIFHITQQSQINQRFRRPSSDFWKFYCTVVSGIFFISAFAVGEFGNRQQYNCEYCDEENNKTNMSISHITFVSYLNPYTSLNKYKIQCVNSWLNVSNNTHVIFLKASSKVDKSGKFAANFPSERVKFRFVKRTDLRKQVYVDDWFNIGAKLSTTHYVTFIRPDILVTNKWLKLLKRVSEHFNNDTTMIYAGRGYAHRGAPRTIFPEYFMLNVVHHNKLIERVPPFITSGGNWAEWIHGWLNNEAKVVALECINCTHYLEDNSVSRGRVDIRRSINKDIALTNGNYSLALEGAKFLANSTHITSGAQIIKF